MSGRQTYNEEEKRDRNLSTCLYFKVTEQMTMVSSTSIQYPVKKQAANFSLCFQFGEKVLHMINFIGSMKN